MADEHAAAAQPAQDAQRGPEVAAETVSGEQVAAIARVLGLDPANVVRVEADQFLVRVVLYDPPAGDPAVRHPLLRQVSYVVEW